MLDQRSWQRSVPREPKGIYLKPVLMRRETGEVSGNRCCYPGWGCFQAGTMHPRIYIYKMWLTAWLLRNNLFAMIFYANSELNTLFTNEPTSAISSTWHTTLAVFSSWFWGLNSGILPDQVEGSLSFERRAITTTILPMSAMNEIVFKLWSINVF